MKTILLCSLLFCAITLPAIGELTPQDLNQIRLIIHEENKPIKTEVASLKTEVTSLKTEVASLKTEVTGVKNDVAWVRGRIEGLDKQIAYGINLTYALIALIVLVVGIPQIIMVWRERKDHTQERQIQQLIQEMETLKQQLNNR